ncbi:hypothetical protein ACLBXX_02715 [Microbacterium sp. C23T]
MNTITGWDHLEEAVDQLATTFARLLDTPDEVICSLPFAEAEALAEVFEAGMHADVAARLMHRWALTEPNWADEHGDAIRHWLALDANAAPIAN